MIRDHRPAAAPRRRPRRRWLRVVGVVLAVALAIGGGVECRKVEDARILTQLETLVETVAGGEDGPTVRTRPGIGRLKSRYFTGFWGSRELTRTPDDSVADLGIGAEAAALDPPTCLVPTERTLGILRAVDHTLVDAEYICEVRGGRRYLGRVVVRRLDDGMVKLELALGRHPMVPSIHRHFPDAERTTDEHGVTYLS